MVLSPIEPVAPSTVTVLTPPAAAGLLFFKGTALINSPNHQRAADTFGAAAQNTSNCCQNDCSYKTVEAIKQPAMAGNDVTRILDAEPALARGLKETAKRRKNKNQPPDQQKRNPFPQTKPSKPPTHGKAGRKTADRTSPCLFWADPRP